MGKIPRMPERVREEEPPPNKQLIWGAEHDLLGVVKRALIRGADINHQNKKGRTALIISAERLNVNIVEELLLHNPDVDVQDNNGNTALMMICRDPNYYFFEAALEASKKIANRSKNLNLRNKRNQTALSFALSNDHSNNHLHLADHLIRFGACYSELKYSNIKAFNEAVRVKKEIKKEQHRILRSHVKNKVRDIRE